MARLEMDRPATVACLLPAVLGLFLTASAPRVFGWEWPLSPPHFAVSFGENGGSGFEKGVLLVGTDSDVHASDTGKVVFVRDGDPAAATVPRAFGNIVVVDNNEGFRTIYANLADGSIPAALNEVEEGSVIGRTGTSGLSHAEGTFFEIIDQSRGRIVNPQTLLPPAGDRTVPVVTGVYLESTPPIALVDDLTVERGSWRMELGTYDPPDQIAARAGADQTPNALAPFGVAVTLNGKPLIQIQLAMLIYHDGKYYLDSAYHYDFAGVYAGRSLYSLGEVELSPGSEDVIVRSSDFSGNEATLERKFLVVAPAPAGTLGSGGASTAPGDASGASVTGAGQ